MTTGTASTAATDVPVRRIKERIAKELDESYGGSESAADAAQRITDMLRKEFSDLEFRKDLWVSADFAEWQITVARPGGADCLIEDNAAKDRSAKD